MFLSIHSHFSRPSQPTENTVRSSEYYTPNNHTCTTYKSASLAYITFFTSSRHRTIVRRRITVRLITGQILLYSFAVERLCGECAEAATEVTSLITHLRYCVECRRLLMKASLHRARTKGRFINLRHFIADSWLFRRNHMLTVACGVAARVSNFMYYNIVFRSLCLTVWYLSLTFLPGTDNFFLTLVRFLSYRRKFFQSKTLDLGGYSKKKSVMRESERWWFLYIFLLIYQFLE